MIDVHCHLLPNIDDGPGDWETAIRMARLAYADGVRKAITTPHWTGAEGEVERCRGRLGEHQERLKAAAIPLEVHLGQEVILIPSLAKSLAEGSALTLAGSSYVLLETAQLEFGAFNHQALFQLQAAGYRIILAHPERVPTWKGRYEELTELLERGCYVQVNGGSLLGSFGSAAKRSAEEMLRRGWVSLLASDAHSDTSRPPCLRRAAQRCATLVGDEATERLVNENPARVLCNELLPYPELDREPRRRAWSWPWR
ncbi:MAG: tyrosine protein phosphatase [Armatimonadetes bacterium]|nr:tyrosine protein phosphatase [Armatimonadota bacterium]